MQPARSIGSFLWALLLVLVAFICMGSSFKQELWFYDVEGNAHVFYSHSADTADLALFLPKVTSYCTRGFWGVYSGANFQTYQNLLGSSSNSTLLCYNYTSAATVSSLRHFGANNTDIDALSLYEETSYSGKEVFVTARAHLGITHRIVDVAGTGTSDWTLFEGLELDGKSVCYTVPPTGGYISYGHVSSLNLTTVGSVFRGCDIQEIQNYKMLHKSRFVNSN